MARTDLFLFLLHACFLFLLTDAVRRHGGVQLRSQQEALLQWKSTLQRSPALDSWRQETSPCSSNWTGVVCGAVHRGRHRAPLAVTGISLPYSGIGGRLGELNFSALTFLQYIDLSYNSLHGEIPLAITSLPALSYLDLSGNWLSGQVPSEIGNIGSLTLLRLPFNNLTGCVPSSLGNLTKLVTLEMEQNNLDGPIPEELGKLTGLERSWI
ncbi:unnamed protein product [Urochloa humidicola]